jgi:16S rRNA (uracil1498-N3)-methyltransferase
VGDGPAIGRPGRARQNPGVERAFFLAPDPSWAADRSGAGAGDLDGPPRGLLDPRLSDEEQAHARRVLRLGPGDLLTGLDGLGGRHPLRVARVERGRLVLEPAGAPERDPAPGEPGAPLPWIEVATALPREKRAEALIDQLTQLGLAALTPLSAERTQGPRRELSDGRRRRLERAAREACKQCGRSWLPVLEEPRTTTDWLALRAGGPILLLDPAAGGRLADAAALEPDDGTRARPLSILVGPEGGFTPEEHAAALAAGARAVRLAPHVLRIETAAVAALAGLVQALDRGRG